MKQRKETFVYSKRCLSGWEIFLAMPCRLKRKPMATRKNACLSTHWRGRRVEKRVEEEWKQRKELPSQILPWSSSQTEWLALRHKCTDPLISVKPTCFTDALGRRFCPSTTRGPRMTRLLEESFVLISGGMSRVWKSFPWKYIIGFSAVHNVWCMWIKYTTDVGIPFCWSWGSRISLASRLGSEARAENFTFSVHFTDVASYIWNCFMHKMI